MSTIVFLQAGRLVPARTILKDYLFCGLDAAISPDPCPTL